MDLCSLAGVTEVGVIAELFSDDGSMMRFDEISKFGSRWDLPVATIDELIAYQCVADFRLQPNSARASWVVETVLNTPYRLVEPADAREYGGAADWRSHLPPSGRSYSRPCLCERWRRSTSTCASWSSIESSSQAQRQATFRQGPLL